MKITRVILCGILALTALAPVSLSQANELNIQIQTRNEELRRISDQILEQQKKLQEAQSEKKTLSSEVSRLDSSLKQIDLGVKLSQTAVEKLELEMRSISKDIEISEDEITQKEAAVGEVLRHIQGNDAESVLFLFLRNKSLSDGVLEFQSLKDVYDTLLSAIESLEQSKDRMGTVLLQAQQAKNQKAAEQINLTSRREIAKDIKEEKERFLKETKNREKIFQDSLKELEQRQLEIAQEIVEIESKLRQQINYKNLPKNLPGLLAIPIARYTKITQEYGATAAARRFYSSGFHNGLDLGSPVGTEVFAAEDGVVISTDDQDRYCRKGAYGKYVLIKHPIGLTTMYAHLSLYKVKEGDIVKRGQIIGYVGNTGFSTGPHLHFTVYDSSTVTVEPSRVCGPKMPYGGHIDPINYLSL